MGFIRAVVEDVAAKLPLDTRRVYATGISNGAMMSSRLACDTADLVAAVAVVAGTAPDGFEAWCKPARPVSVIAFLGTADPLVPYEGGEITAVLPVIRRGRVVGADALRDFWVDANGCSPAAVVASLPNVARADRSTVHAETFASCRDDVGVVFYRIEGDGHTWPGGRQYLARFLVGPTNRDVDATETIWRFFAGHARP